MILDEVSWMNIRRFRALHERGATYADIARECGVDWRTVRKYLAEDALVTPPVAPSRDGTQPQVIAPFVDVVEAWVRADPSIKGSVVHERLVAEYGFTGSYQRVKMFLATARPRIVADLQVGDENPLTGLHRRFETVAGAQAQVDWGDEGDLLGHVGIGHVYSFHMTLSYSRDPFCCFTTSMDAATFWACHRRAFTHFGGVPGAIVYDRTKTVVRRHVAPRLAVPIHPEGAAFAAHYGFVIDVLAAYRPTGKGRVERQVSIVRDHVLAGRTFSCLQEVDAAFAAWVPIRRAQVHRTHGQVIGVRAAVDHAALGALPSVPYVVDEQHLRRVGKDALISFEGSCYSVPARAVRPGQRVGVRVTPETVTIHALTAEGDTTAGGQPLASHLRSGSRGSWVVDPAHWDGLPDGHTRAVTLAEPTQSPKASPPTMTRHEQEAAARVIPLAQVLSRHHADLPVVRRPLAEYATAAGVTR
jgi:transposase